MAASCLVTINVRMLAMKLTRLDKSHVGSALFALINQGAGE